MVDPTCFPTTRCTNLYTERDPLTGAGTLVAEPGLLRESIIAGSDHGVFDGVGPGVDLEVDTARIGPLGVSLFLGMHAYYLPGDRDIRVTVSQSHNDADLDPATTGIDTDVATWRVRVEPWIYRAGVGIRFSWLGTSD